MNGPRMSILLTALAVMAGVPTGEPDWREGRADKDSTRQSDGPTVLITGSNRGIGLAFARQYAEKGWNVIATARNPEAAEALQALAAEHPTVVIERLDVTDHTAIDVLAQNYRDRPIDVLINNAGVLGAPEDQALEGLDFDTFEEVMAVNTYGPLKVSQAFLEHVAASEQKKIVVISSPGGSLAVNAQRGVGGFYFYRISKAGVNMAMLLLQAEVRDRGIKVGIFSPGLVNTRMLRQTGYRGRRRPIEPEASVAALIERIEDLTAENAATHIAYDGRTIPW